MKKIPLIINTVLVSSLLLIAAASAQSLALRRSPAYEPLTARVVRTIALPKGYHEGLYHDGSRIWVNNGKRGKTWVIDIASGRVVRTLEPISTFTEGVTPYTDGLFFATDWDERMIYRMRLDGDRMVAEAGISVAPAYPAGLLWDGKRLLVITWTFGMGVRYDILIYDAALRFQDAVEARYIREPSQLAWDGKGLWISSWCDRTVYRIDPERWEITASFRTPLKQATGLACDGAHLWLTGTHADLVQLELTPAAEGRR